jgi:hypothetical protein
MIKISSKNLSKGKTVIFSSTLLLLLLVKTIIPLFEVDPLLCPQCGSQMRIIAFLTDYAVVDRIIQHLKLTFVAERPPPPSMAYQELWMDSETGAEYFS